MTTPVLDGVLVHGAAEQRSPDGRDTADHLPYLDGLRACLAAYVVLHHTYRTAAEGTVLPPSVMMLGGWLQFGRVAVDGFIILSGYCLMLPVLRHGGYLRKGVGWFYWGRARRILPTFYAAVLISAVIASFAMSDRRGTPWDACLPVRGHELLGNLIMCQDLWPGGGRVNYVFWSVAVEWRIYLAFPLLVWTFRRFGACIPTATTVLMALGVATALARHQAMATTLSYVGLFVIGMGVAAGVGDRAGAGLLLGLAIVATLVAAGRLWFGGLPVLGLPLTDLAVGVAFAATLAYLARRPSSAVRRTLGTRPFEILGAISYSLYLTHAMTVEAVWRILTAAPLRLTGMRAAAALFVVVIPMAVALAYVFFLAAERPFLSARQRMAAHQASQRLA